ncbi:MAG TPA: division/cell wall cluster transcriptional repressor MraZ [Planctomycetaceae bacterium]|nr:division/cell wall cluster transcriptional repressor MraZ [Planctomycetaceae bacterium]
MALTGTYTRSLDDKRRLAFPKRLRDDFGEADLNTLFLAPGTDRSLAIYSPPAFDRLARKLARRPANQAGIRNYLRLFYAQAEKCDLDSQGRICIPDRLAEHAGLQREVVLLGVHDHAEIWDTQAWAEYLARNTPDFDAIAAQAFEE